MKHLFHLLPGLPIVNIKMNTDEASISYIALFPIVNTEMNADEISISYVSCLQ